MKKYVKYSIFGVVALVVLFIVAKSTGIIGSESRIEVDTVQVVRRTLTQRIYASGSLFPIIELEIAPDVAGEVTEIFVKEGDTVQEGQLLAKIRPDNFINALQRQQAQLEQIRVQLNRTKASLRSTEANFLAREQDYLRKKKLFEDKVISEAEFQSAEASYKVAQQDVVSAKEQISASKYQLSSAEASVREAKENLRLTTLFSPLKGRIIKQLVEMGERVVGTQQMRGTNMFHIGDLSEMELRVRVVENDIVRLSLYDSAEISLESFPAHKIKGVVTYIAHSAVEKTNPEAVTEYEVKIQLIRSSYTSLAQKTGKDTPLLPGMSASVEIITEVKENALSVPISAVTIQRSTQRRDSPQNKDNSNERERFRRDNARNEPSTEQKTPQEIVFLYSSGKAEIKEVKTGITTRHFIEIIEGIEEGELVISGPFLVVSRRLRDQEKVKPRAPTRKRGARRKGSSSSEKR